MWLLIAAMLTVLHGMKGLCTRSVLVLSKGKKKANNKMNKRRSEGHKILVCNVSARLWEGESKEGV